MLEKYTCESNKDALEASLCAVLEGQAGMQPPKGLRLALLSQRGQLWTNPGLA